MFNLESTPAFLSGQAMSGPVGTAIGAVAVVGLVLLMAAVFRAREDGHGVLAGLIALFPLAYIGLTAMLRSVDLSGDRTWFMALAGVWVIVMGATLGALTVLILRSDRKGVAMAAFFLFPVFGLYMGALQLGMWAGN